MSATFTPSRPSVRPKGAQFPVTVEWLGGRRVATCIAGKPVVNVEPPVVFRGTDPSVWSPEDFFVAAAASCLAITFTGLAERASLPLAGLRVDGEGDVGRRYDGYFGFMRIRLGLRIIVAPTDTELARSLAVKAEENCLVAASCALPIDVSIDVRAAGD